MNLFVKRRGGRVLEDAHPYPPVAIDMQLPTTLYTFPISMYNLRAEWALELAGLPPLHRVCLAPFLHVPVMAVSFALAGVAPRGKDSTSSPFGTPQLIIHAGRGDAARLLRSGDEIIAWADGGEAHRVFPPRDAPLPLADAQAEAALCNALHDDLGKAVRAWAYTHVAYSLREWVWAFAPNAGPVSAALWVLCTPLILPLMRSVMGVWDQRRARACAEERIRAVFARVSQRLGARNYLFGDVFGPADLDFAALGALAAGLAEEAFRGAARVRPNASFPPGMQAFMAEMRGTRAGQHIAEVLRKHRTRAA